MLDREPPAWRIDAKWVSGILLALVVAVLVPVFSLTQLSARQRALPLLEQVLELTLLTGGEDDLAAGVRQDLEYEPGEPFELLPGAGVTISPEQLSRVTPSDAVTQLASALTGQIMAEGAPAALETVEGSALEPQLRAALEGSAAQLVRSLLVLEMLPAGIENGSRLANWPLQAQQNPGQEVQPIVGLFVTVPPEEIQGLSPRNVGVRAVEELAGILLNEGEAAASELITNPNLQARLDQAVAGPIPSELQDLFETLLLPQQPLIAERLEQARSVVAASQVEEEPLTLGVVTADELAALDSEEANRLVLERLAQRAYSGGSAALSELVSDQEQAARLAGAARVVDSLSEQAHSRYLRFTWILGIAAVLLAVLLVAASRGWGRLSNPGFALLLAAAAGAGASLGMARLASGWQALEAPAGLGAQGAFAHLAALLRFIGGSLPSEGLELLVRNHLIVLAAGAALIVLALVLRILGALRPRRRSFI